MQLFETLWEMRDDLKAYMGKYRKSFAKIDWSEHRNL